MTAHAFFKFPGVLSCTTFERLCQGGLVGLLMCPLQDEGRREKTKTKMIEFDTKRQISCSNNGIVFF